jgi:hypothetical protein
MSVVLADGQHLNKYSECRTSKTAVKLKKNIMLEYSINIIEAGVAQSVQCLTMDWMTGQSRFHPQ